MPINAPGTALDNIKIKVRRLTRSPSTAQLSDDDLNTYVNTFILYDFPEHLRTFNLRTTVSFTCNPYQDVYNTDIASFGAATGAQNNPLYNFQNKYLTIHPPFFIAGFPAAYMQDRTAFFGIYPKVNSIQTIGVTGNGIQTSFSGVIVSQGIVQSPTLGVQQGSCFVKGEVLFSSVDINNNGLSLVDVPCIDSVTGNPTVWGNLFVPGTEPATPPIITNYTTLPVPTGVDATNFINYVTGQFTITFNDAPQSGFAINSQTLLQIVSLPQSVLFYNNKFVLRPIPDQPYEINFEAFVRPTFFMENTQSPQLEEWWQYIAYSAALKVFQDRMDLDSVALIMPELKMQERLCLRRTLVQQTNQRTATIYTDQSGLQGGPGWFGFGSPSGF